MKTPRDVRGFFAKWYPKVFGPNGPSEEIAKDFLERRCATWNGEAIHVSQF